MGGAGAGIDDCRLLVLQQMRHHGARAQQVAAQVNGDGAVEHGKVERQGVRVLHDHAQVRCVDMRAIKAAQALHRSLDRFVHRLFVRNIDMDGKGPIACRLRRCLCSG